MVQEAQRRGANAVVGMRFDTGEIAASFSEVCAYGTAVVVSPLAAGQPGATAQSAHQAQGAPSAPAAGRPRLPAGRRAGPARLALTRRHRRRGAGQNSEMMIGPLTSTIHATSAT